MANRVKTHNVQVSEKQKTHNENNHVQVSEKQNATSVIIIQINSVSLKNQKKFYIIQFFI